MPPERVDAIADRLGREVRASLRRVLTTVASRLEFAWFAPSEQSFRDPFHQIFSGNLSWSLDDLPDLMAAVHGWVENVFPDPNDPYDRV